MGAQVIITISGFDPAGGWTVRVTCITPMAVARAKAMLHHTVPKSAKKINPIKDERK